MAQSTFYFLNWSATLLGCLSWYCNPRHMFIINGFFSGHYTHCWFQLRIHVHVMTNTSSLQFCSTQCCCKFLNSSTLEPMKSYWCDGFYILLECVKLYCNKPANCDALSQEKIHLSHDHEISHHMLTFFESMNETTVHATTWKKAII